MLIIDNMPSTEDPPSTHIGSAAIIGHQSNYCLLPAKSTASISISNTKKYKHLTKSYPICYFEDTESEEDDPGNVGGDGSSSGDSVSNDVPLDTKWQ